MNNLVVKIKKTIKTFINCIVNNCREIAVWIFLTMLALGGVTYFVNLPIDYDINAVYEVKNYVVNKRTNKIHKIGCSSIDRMSTKNKILVNDSIASLTQSGHFICGRCKAGLIRKNELIANTLEKVENLIFSNDEISYKTYDEFLASIDAMGTWYVSHVATYECELDDIATDNAKEYYSKSNLVKRGNILLYPCEKLNNCKGGYNRAGDDCVRYIFSCLNNMDNNFTYMLSKFSKYKWSTINSKSLNIKKNRLQYAMTNLGFEIYDTTPTKVDINQDGYYEFEIFPIEIDFKLKKGDILSRDGHVHIYLSDNENFGWGKVNNTYPQQTKTYVDYTNNKIICNGEEFTRVYRYLGES